MPPVACQVPRPLIALVGRPNVGKSTLFNRLIGSRKAVVSPLRGTTRDRVYGQTRWRGRPLSFVDTGGFEGATQDSLAASVQRHLRRAVEEADGVILVGDGQEGWVPADGLLMDRLRPLGRPVVVAVNKLEAQALIPPEFFGLGATAVVPVSALHGRGVGELLDVLHERFAPPPGGSPVAAAAADIPAIAIVGRPNVGKSSLLNALLRDERVIVSERPGTTRDAVDSWLRVDGRPVVLIDTAGLRHRRKVSSPVDLFAMSRAVEAIRRCDVAVVVLDGAEGVARDDRRIVSHVLRAGRGLVIALNKQDLARGLASRQAHEAVRRRLPGAAFAPVLALSAKTGSGVSRLLGTALAVCRAMRGGLSASACSELIERAWTARPAPHDRGRTVRVLACRWLSGRPAQLELTVSPRGWLPAATQHYLLNRLQQDPRLAGVPVRLVLKAPSHD